jgi:feruloyl esterase
MMLAQRFPEHFDGIVAGNPGFNLPQAAVAQAWDTQAFAALATTAGADGQPYLPSTFSEADLALVAEAVLRRCDALDGLTDGVIDDLPACRFRPATLDCRRRAKPCLSAAQVPALRKVFGGVRNSRGRRLYADWPYDAGIGSPFWRLWKLGSLQSASNDALNVLIGGLALPYVFVTPPAAIAADGLLPYLLGFDFDADARRIFATSGAYTPSAVAFMSARSPNLAGLERRSGKLIVYHGASDPVFSVHDTIAWYRRVLRRMPGARQLARLFVVPGMTHCSGGPATESFDVLAPIVDWVEHGRAPDRIVARARAGTPWPGRTRPLCPYPEQSRYLGTGDIDDADSFGCTHPRSGARR